VATNVYEYEEVYHWGGDPLDGTTYYGWVIITGDSEVKCANFQRPEQRKELLEKVKEIVPQARNPTLLAAAVFIQNTEDPDEVAYDIAYQEMDAAYENRDVDRHLAWEDLNNLTVDAYFEKFSSSQPSERSEE